MSDLQVGLLALGVCGVLGVWLYNRWQERQLRDRAARALATTDDPLLGGSPRDRVPALDAPASAGLEPSGRIEPRLGAAPSDPRAAEQPVAGRVAADSRDGPVDTAALEAIDVEVGLNIVPRAGAGAWSASRLRGLFEAGGFVPVDAGGYVLADASGQRVLAITDRAGTPLTQAALEAAATTGLTLLLDVGRTPGPLAAFDRMTRFARQWTRELGGALVDDDDRPLDDAGLARIRARLEALQAHALAAGLEPGSDRVRRLLASPR